MIIYPAIDLSDGKIVRLLKGNFSQKKIYTSNIEEQVKIFEKNGAVWIHVVDLDGALRGKNKNEISINKIIKNTNCKVQLGGGIRSLNDIEKWLNLGIERVIIGTAAITENELVKEAVRNFPKKIAVGLDLLKDKVAIKGWTETYNKHTAEYFFQKFSDIGVEAIIYTDISKDGVLKGPNFKKIFYYKNKIKVPLIASGGVSCVEDLIKLSSLKVKGVIVGKAIYDKKVDIKKIFSVK